MGPMCPDAGPSSPPYDPEEGPPQDETRSHPLSIPPKERLGKVAFKGKTLDELRRELIDKCAKIEEEHPELAHKDGWSALHDMLKIRDEKDIRNHYDNIDTLLVFAGLYSAILTAFLVEAYKLLQRDSSDASLQVILQISQQLASFAVNSGFANATYVPASLPTGPFTPARSSVWLNGLWFVALILSLATTSLGLLVKQWLREFANYPGATPEEQRRIRLFRIRGLRKYKVSEIATFLPLLLQISLILFFSGLVLFTRGVHATIGWVVMGFVVVWGTFLVFTTVLPWFSASCPYKTPFLKPITTQSRRLLNCLNKRLERFARLIRFDWLYYAIPVELFHLVDAETQISKDSSLDVDVLFDAYKTSGNTNVYPTIMDCVDTQNPSESYSHLCSVIMRIYSLSGEPSTLVQHAWKSLPASRCRLLVKSLVACLRLRLIQAFERKEASELDDAAVDLLVQLDKCRDILKIYSSSRMDRALVQTSSALLQSSLFVPFAPGSFIKYAFWLLQRGLPVLKRWEYFNKSAMTAFVGASNQIFEPSSTLDGEYEVLKRCHGIFFCAGRSTEECRPLLEYEFPQLTRLIASKVDSMPDPSGWQHPYLVFRWHCILDMAMRLHRRIPGIIDKTLFEALNTRSVKMFDLYLEYWLGKEAGEWIEGKPEGVLQTSDISIRPIDWNQVLEKYAEVEIRGKGEYTEDGVKWEYQRLRVDCKYRMEFMLNYECWIGDVFRRILRDHRF